MIRHAKRPVSASDALSLLTFGKKPADAYEIDEATAVRLKRSPSPTPTQDQKSVRCESRALYPTTPTRGIPIVEWIEKVLYVNRGVVSALPSIGSSSPCTVALDQRVASGHAEYWLINMAKNAREFNAEKTRTLMSDNHVSYEAVKLHSTVPAFLPEGDVFGMEVSDADALIDAGFKMEVRMYPYVSRSEVASVQTDARQMAACCMELAMHFSAAERGIAPAVLACFFSQSVDADALMQASEPKSPWLKYDRPKHLLDSSVIHTKEPSGIRSMVLVSQISTFSLDDLMGAIRSAPVQSRKDYLVGVMRSVCGPTFAKIKEMSMVHDGYGLVKLNMAPSSVVFCPELRASTEGHWTLDGMGYMPISKSYLDGMPRIVDYNSMFTTRVRESSHSFETAYAMECMLLVAFTRAQHGPAVAEVLWEHLTSDNDPSGFVGAIRSIRSRSTNTPSFLACVVSNSEMRELPDLSKALAGVVSDMDVIVREGIVNSDGSLRRGSKTPVFSKLVSLVTRSSEVDTRIFSPFAAAPGGHDDDMDAEDMRALERVKSLRLERISATRTP